MKKSLSILLVFVLVLSLFSAISSAATSPAGLELKSYGLIKGNTDGDLMENSKWKRQDVAVILSRLFGKETEAKAYQNNHKFTDVKNSFYNGYISWAKDQNLFTGKSTTLFGFNDDITYQEFIAVVLRSLGYSGTLEIPFANVGSKAFELGLISNALDIRLTANRVSYFDILLKAINTKNTDGIVLGTALKLSNFKEKALTVNSITGISKTVDRSKDGQFLLFSINGEEKPTSYKTLVSAGYSVEFQITNISYLVDKATGELNETNLNLGVNTSFEYTVVVSKNNTAIKSLPVSAKILDYANTASKVLGFKIYHTTDVEVVDKLISISDQNVKFDNVQVEFLDGSTKTYTASGTAPLNLSSLTFATSSATVAITNTDGSIFPVSPGNAIFTIKKDDAKLDIPVTISAESRKATKVTTSVSSLKIGNNITKKVEITILDQFNNPYKGLVVIGATPSSVNKPLTTTPIASVSEQAAGSGTSDKSGKVLLNITSNSTNTGSGTFEIKDGTRLLNSIIIDVGTSSEPVTSRLLEPIVATKEIILDIKTGSTTRTIDLNYNKYDKNGYFQGVETSIASTATTSISYIAESSDPRIATVGVAAGVISVQGIAKGTVNILIKEGSIIRSSLSVNVIDSTPTITTVNYETSTTFAAQTMIPLSSILKTSNIILNDSNKSLVSISNNGEIYIEVSGTGYSSLSDITLGTINLFSYVKNGNNMVRVGFDPATGSIAKNISTTATPSYSNFSANDVGQIVLNITKAGSSFPQFATLIQLDVK